MGTSAFWFTQLWDVFTTECRNDIDNLAGPSAIDAFGKKYVGDGLANSLS